MYVNGLEHRFNLNGTEHKHNRFKTTFKDHKLPKATRTTKAFLRCLSFHNLSDDRLGLWLEKVQISESTPKFQGSPPLSKHISFLSFSQSSAVSLHSKPVSFHNLSYCLHSLPKFPTLDLVRAEPCEHA